MADFLSDYPSPPSSLPFAPDRDARLSPGVLCLYDMIHSTDPVGSGVASGLTIPNIAEDYLIDLLGSGSPGDFDGHLQLGAGNTSAAVRLERTSKGGLHVLMSQVSNTVNTQGAYIDLAAAIKTYLIAHPNNDYFIAMANRVTRAAVGGSGGVSDRPPSSVIYTTGVSAPSNSLYGILPNGLIGDVVHYDTTPGLNTVGERFVALDVATWQGTDPAAVSAFPACWGQVVGSWQTSTYQNRSASSVFHWWMLEDLTVSGRTFAEVSQICKDFWTAETSVGGRWYGDTLTTDPSAFP